MLQRITAATRQQLKHTRRFSSLPASDGASAPVTAAYNPIYVAATRQHVGKTSVSLALISGLLKRFPKSVGFLKPVGQISLLRDGVQVDKDAALIKEHFEISSDYCHTSPVLIPPGYTRDYLDGKITSDMQMHKIHEAFNHIQASHDIVLAEGTGHVSVGSIVDASNADICGSIGAKIVLVVNGGLGNTFDELELNRVFCESKGIEIAGVVINKVLRDKYDQTKEYLSKAIGSDIPILGCIPDRPFLGCPALADLERVLNSTLISGKDHRLRHYRTSDITVVADSLDVFLKNLRAARAANARRLYVCHASRDDILLGFLMNSVMNSNGEIAMAVTGCTDHPISTQVLEVVTGLKEAPPVLLTESTTANFIDVVYNFTPKLNIDDYSRVKTTVSHYEPYIDFDLLLKQLHKTEETQTAVPTS